MTKRQIQVFKKSLILNTQVVDFLSQSQSNLLYRQVVKRKRFTDEISEPSDLDLDDEEDILAGDDSADEYNPGEHYMAW